MKRLVRVRNTRIGAMNIQSSRNANHRITPRPQPRAQEPTPETTSSQVHQPWRQIPLNEAVVEIPQSIFELSPLTTASPLAAKGVQLGVSSLAMARAVQCFHDAESLEEIMEGVSSGALALAGGATLLPGAAASFASQSLLAVHGGTELALGLREVKEELSKAQPAKLELAAGVLDSIKGASTFLPLFFPETATAVNIFQIGAILTKTVMEPHMERSRQRSAS